jgi:hypothetical protein
MNREETEKKVRVTCHGIDPEPFQCSVLHPEKPGEFCFPPLASLITGAARLMLALLEHSVTTLGGTYAMEDTDSMAVVATRNGGVIPCEGGDLTTDRGESAIRALSWEQVNQIAKRFESLNPYDRKIIGGSVLKIEDDNFDPKNGKQRQLYCLAISAKRYALFSKSEDDTPSLLRQKVNNKKDRWSKHGLGHLLNPSDPERSDRNWTAAVWERLIRKSLGLEGSSLSFATLPAIGRITVSSPALLKCMKSLNDAKPYSEQIKPFNFLLTCNVKALGHLVGCDPERFHLITPYDPTPQNWLKKEWVDQYTGLRFRITTMGQGELCQRVRVKTYGDVIEEYEFHPESKCADVSGNVCDQQTMGLLRRRHIRIDQIKFIGKESNSLEDVDAGLEHSEKNVYTEYTDSKRDEWKTKIQPALKKTSLKLIVKECANFLSRRALIDLRADRSRPHRGNQTRLVEVLNRIFPNARLKI